MRIRIDKIFVTVFINQNPCFTSTQLISDITLQLVYNQLSAYTFKLRRGYCPSEADIYTAVVLFVAKSLHPYVWPLTPIYTDLYNVCHIKTSASFNIYQKAVAERTTCVAKLFSVPSQAHQPSQLIILYNRAPR